MTAHKASIIIPTKNPGSHFQAVLSSVCAQEADFTFDILVIDSGSTDGTVAYILEHADTRVYLHQIPPVEFGHGKTRNLGISLTRGEYAVLITHDAQPVAPDWLDSLVAIAESDPQIAGVFGRHVAYPTAGPFTARDLDTHFDQFRNKPIRWIENPQRYAADEKYRQGLWFFSDNNALIRRSVWEQIPYSDVDFAEDQMWAKAVLEQGWKIAYAHNAVVYHSHDYGVSERLRRSFDEGYAMFKLFDVVLLKSIFHAFAFCARRTVNDFVFAWRHKLWRKHFSAILRMPIDNIMRAGGYYLGAHGQRLPRAVRQWLSLDRRLLLGLDARVMKEKNNERP